MTSINRTQKARLSFVTLIFLLNFYACKTPGPSSSKPAGVHAGNSYILSQSTLSVCWINGDQIAETYKEDLRDYTIEQFNKTRKIRFIGWKTCAMQDYLNPTVKIFVYGNRAPALGEMNGIRSQTALNLISGDEHPGHPRVLALGSKALLADVSMIINGADLDVHPRLLFLMSELRNNNPHPQLAIKNLQKTIFVHEIGHILGLMHEHSHPLNDGLTHCDPSNAQSYIHNYVPKDEADAQLAELRASYLASVFSLNHKGRRTEEYDANSIMNYCKTYSHDYSTPLPLSETDILFIDSIYP